MSTKGSLTELTGRGLTDISLILTCTLNSCWRAGWFTFLKPLPPGDHKASYSLSVQGLGADNVASEKSIAMSGSSSTMLTILLLTDIATATGLRAIISSDISYNFYAIYYV